MGVLFGGRGWSSEFAGPSARQANTRLRGDGCSHRVGSGGVLRGYSDGDARKPVREIAAHLPEERFEGARGARPDWDADEAPADGTRPLDSLVDASQRERVRMGRQREAASRPTRAGHEPFVIEVLQNLGQMRFRSADRPT